MEREEVSAVTDSEINDSLPLSYYIGREPEDELLADWPTEDRNKDSESEKEEMEGNMGQESRLAREDGKELSKEDDKQKGVKDGTEEGLRMIMEMLKEMEKVQKGMGSKLEEVQKGMDSKLEKVQKGMEKGQKEMKEGQKEMEKAQKEIHSEIESMKGGQESLRQEFRQRMDKMQNTLQGAFAQVREEEKKVDQVADLTGGQMETPVAVTGKPNEVKVDVGPLGDVVTLEGPSANWVREKGELKVQEREEEKKADQVADLTGGQMGPPVAVTGKPNVVRISLSPLGKIGKEEQERKLVFVWGVRENFEGNLSRADRALGVCPGQIRMREKLGRSFKRESRRKRRVIRSSSASMMKGGKDPPFRKIRVKPKKTRLKTRSRAARSRSRGRKNVYKMFVAKEKRKWGRTRLKSRDPMVLIRTRPKIKMKFRNNFTFADQWRQKP